MPSGFPRQVARLSAISLLSSTRTSTLQSRSIPRQLLHDLLSISSFCVLRPSDSQAHLRQARKDRFLPIVNSDANGICTVRARTQYPVAHESCFESTTRKGRPDYWCI